METSRKIMSGVVALVMVALALVLFWPEASEKLAPDPRRAWVAIQADGEEVAEVGTVTLPAASQFSLHAVLEAENRDGTVLYYTEAPALRIGGNLVPAESIRPWDRPQIPKVRWFTVEGSVPHLRIGSETDLERFHFQDFLRAAWPESWSVPGRLDGANDDELSPDPEAVEEPVGTQRYSVWIEFYDDETSYVPARRYAAPGAGELTVGGEAQPTTVHRLPENRAAAAARYLGLTHLELQPAAEQEVLQQVWEWTDRALAYSGVPLLAHLLEASGTDADGLCWRRLDLREVQPRWGEEVAAGDLLRAGARWVVLYRDRGQLGVLDYEDLCLDFTQAPVVWPLKRVFSQGGELELGRLPGA